jgi:hypothetical protein
MPEAALPRSISYAAGMRRSGFAIATIATSAILASPIRADTPTSLSERVVEIAKEVAALRGLPMKQPIPSELVNRAELHARLAKLAAEDDTASATGAQGLALARWGMIPLDTDYGTKMVDLLTEQIAGYYDPQTKKLTILDGGSKSRDDVEWAEMVIAHELDHGLQDQSFDLQAFQKVDATEGDAALARHALIEGDGIVLMLEVKLARNHVPPPWSNPEVAAVLMKGMSVPTGDALDAAPLAIREAMMFPYREGFGFVAALRRRQPWTAVDAAWKRPPRSTEQILHVDKYLADEAPIAIVGTAPRDLGDFAITSSTVWGEYGFQLFLRSHGVAEGVAVEAAAGWGGDRMIVLARPGEKRAERAIGLSRSEWDTEADAAEAQAAAVRAIDDAVLGVTFENTDTRTSWLAVDGTVAWVERRGNTLVIAIGVPAGSAESLVDEAWYALAPAATIRRPVSSDRRQ